MAQYSEQDQILLNSYLDGRLGASERSHFEARLAGDAALRAELETLRLTVELLSKAERVPVPRHFTLNPAAFAAPVRRSFLERLGLGPVPGWAIATASMVLVAICAGVLLLGPNAGRTAGSTVALAPMVMPAATEAAMEEFAAEAPTEEATESMMYAATEEAPMDATGAKMVPPVPGTHEPPLGGATGGGDVGAAGGNDGMGGEDGAGGGVPPSEPNPQAIAQSTSTVDAYAAQDTQSQAAGAAPAVGEAGDSARNGGTEAATAPPVTPIVGEEVNPWEGINGSSLAILLGGTGLLIALVLGITILRRRH